MYEGFWLQIALMAASLLLSAFFSATETAFSSLNRVRLKAMADHGDKRAIRALALAERYDELLSTILVGNNVVNIALASIGTAMFVKLIGSAGVPLSTAVVTIVVLIFGEVSPKSMAKESPERFAMFAAPLIRPLAAVLKPINWLFGRWKAILSRIFRVKDEHAFTQDELISIVQEAEQDGGMNRQESELVQSAIEFHDLDVGDILTPRVQVEGVEAGSDVAAIDEVFAQSDFSRLPVYQESMDHIIGYIHQKDFSNAVRRGEVKLEEIMKKPVYVPVTAKISDVLRLLQKTKSQMAVVSDEYGGTMGIVTMEDILEELVGEIWDEYDETEEPIQQVGKDMYQVLGSAEPEELFKRFGLSGDTEASTVGGWVMERMERVPENGTGFDYEGWHATVLESDGRHVQTIEWTRLSPVTDSAEAQRTAEG